MSLIWTGTAPTFAAGDNATVVANLNTLRDAVKAASEAWTAYTPVWTGASTNPVLGNGSFVGSAYRRVNKAIEFRIILTMGSSTTYGTGQWIFTAPVSPVTTTTRVPFIADLYDAGTNAWPGTAAFFTASKLYLYCHPTTAGNPYRSVDVTTPFSWGTGDQVVITGSYEAA